MKTRYYKASQFYHSHYVVKKAANTNKIPKSVVFKHVLKISLILGPILAIILWLL